MSDSTTMSWMPFVVLSILNWGLYGLFLHTGQSQMADPVFGRYKAFLFVGLAYLIVGVLASAILLAVQGATWNFTTGGMVWSLLAGVLGAVGAFGVLLAFGAKGSPAVVMSLVFAGAPIVNAIATIILHKLWGQIQWPFLLGIGLAAVGAFLVVTYKPAPKALGPTAPSVTPTPEVSSTIE